MLSKKLTANKKMHSKTLSAKLLLSSVVASAVIAFASSAQADTTIQYQLQNGGEMSMSLTDSHLRIETGQGQWMLFDSEADAMYMIQPAIQQYAVMDRSAIAAISAQAKSAMAEMEEAMAGMSEQEKAMMQRMMGGRFQLPNTEESKPKASVTETGKSDKVSGFACDVKEYDPGTGDTTQLCVADIKTLGVSQAEYKVALKMSALMLELAESMPFGSGQDVQDMSQLGGIPVRSQNASGQNLQVVTSVNHSEIDREKFKIPAGFTPQSI